MDMDLGLESRGKGTAAAPPGALLVHRKTPVAGPPAARLNARSLVDPPVQISGSTSNLFVLLLHIRPVNFNQLVREMLWPWKAAVNTIVPKALRYDK